MPSPSAPDLERTALKEWAVLVDAMARGEIIAMVRKGGIREQRAGFAVRHERFLLYPTFFHEKAAELSPRFVPLLEGAHARRPSDGMIHLEYVAEAVAVWRVDALAPLERIGDEHGLTWAAVDARFHYRNNPGVQVVAVRVRRITPPAVLPEVRRYGGCVSWVELDEAVDVAAADPVVDAERLRARVMALREILGPTSVESGRADAV
jgi:hypothetical protein